MKKHVFDLIMPVLPKHDLSHWVGRLVHQRVPGPLGRKSVEIFAKYYGIDLNEAEHPLEHYQCIGELFTRKLKPGARPIGKGIVHPADSAITEAGEIKDLTLIQAKGKSYTVSELLPSAPYSRRFDGGQFLTYYLCPTDYHRVHSPVDGNIVWSCHVPGGLWPVNDWSVNAIPKLFAVNERVITVIETSRGLAALVMVAATNVGNMTMSFDQSISTRLRKGPRTARERSYDPAIAIQRGGEIGIFHMGSTVVMLYEKGVLEPGSAERCRNSRVKVGESLC